MDPDKLIIRGWDDLCIRIAYAPISERDYLIGRVDLNRWHKALKLTNHEPSLRSIEKVKKNGFRKAPLGVVHGLNL